MTVILGPYDEETHQVSVLDHGFVRLDACMADDLSVVNSARVSFASKHVEFENESDTGLLNYLMKNKHGTPFEHNAFRFHVKCPIFIAREWMRHRIGSFNEWSARYSTLEPEFYVPKAEDTRSRVGKPGNYTYEQADKADAYFFGYWLKKENERCYEQYIMAMDQRIAPEQARFFLPVNIYTQFYWTVNARSLMNFLSLRNAETAMWEIQQYAKATEWFFALEMPVTATAFVRSGRVAP